MIHKIGKSLFINVCNFDFIFNKNKDCLFFFLCFIEGIFVIFKEKKWYFYIDYKCIVIKVMFKLCFFSMCFLFLCLFNRFELKDSF